MGNTSGPSKTPMPTGKARSRLGLYAVLAIAAVIALAYFDGGEEPIRPMSVPVELPTGSSESN